FSRGGVGAGSAGITSGFGSATSAVAPQPVIASSANADVNIERRLRSRSDMVGARAGGVPRDAGTAPNPGRAAAPGKRASRTRGTDPDHPPIVIMGVSTI